MAGKINLHDAFFTHLPCYAPSYIQSRFVAIVTNYLPWWPSCLDHGALINLDAPGFGTSVDRGPTGRK